PTSTVEGNKQASVLQELNQHVTNAAAAHSRPTRANGAMTSSRYERATAIASEARMSSIRETVRASNETQDRIRRQKGTSPNRTRLSKKETSQAASSKMIASVRRRFAIIALLELAKPHNI